MNQDDGVDVFSPHSKDFSSYPVKHEEKVCRILQKMLQPQFRIRNDECLNSLLSYLATNNAELGCPLLSSPIYINWLIQVKASWCNFSSLKPSANILSFSIQLAALVSTHEITFDCLYQHQVYEALIQLLSPIRECKPELKFAFLKLLNALIGHGKGLAWVLDNNYWRYALELCLSRETVHIAQEGYDFMGKLIDTTSQCNRGICDEVIENIMLPLGSNAIIALQKQSNSVEVNDEEMYKVLEPTLKLLSNMLLVLLSPVADTKNFYFYLVIKNKYELEKQISKLMLIAQSEAFNYDLQEVNLLLMMHDSLANMGDNNKLNEQATLEGAKKLLEMCNAFVAKGQVANVIKIVFKMGFVWQKIRYKVKASHLHMEKVLNYDTDPLTFGNQVFLLQLVPIFLASFKILPIRPNDTENADVRMEYFTKLFKMTAAPVWRFMYKLRDSLDNCPRVFEFASLSLQYILKAKKYYRKEMGVSLFQALIYCLYDNVTVIKKNPTICGVLLVEASYTTLLLDAVAEYIEEFQITWRDSVESIRVMDIALDFLSMPDWPPQFVVKALKLVEISISKFLAPNLALLVDEISDSTMTFIGPLLYTKLHDVSWEVRNSALRVLRTISLNAHTKFPSFQKVVLDSKLPSLAVKIALHDEEGIVRATALKCLQDMMQVQDFYDEITENYDLTDKVIEILRCDTESMVRMEAATLMAISCELNRLPSGVFLDRVYDIMTYAAINDLHWEVKKNSLRFWQVVINEHLQQQGMIDGSFPNVVFSKEHRKIINLTEEEVRKRLFKVLDQLSAIGCLYVLIAVIQDEDNVAVAQVAMEQIKELRNLLEKYKVYDSFKSLGNLPNSIWTNKVKLEPITHAEMLQNINKIDTFENIMDSFLNTNDRLLMDDVAKNGMINGKCNMNGNHFEERKILSSSQFLQFLAHEDLDARFDCKQLQMRKGLDDVGFLLDDILKECDLNSMDCFLK